MVQALAGLAALLRTPGLDPPDAAGADDPTLIEARHLLQALAEDGGAAAGRVLAYLRLLRGPGDGASAAVQPRLGPWRDWTPSRGHLFGDPGGARRLGHLPHPRRCDPGE